jgi:beta-glucosidase
MAFPQSFHWGAIDVGVELRGYFVWSSMDNCEWTQGCEPRFGIVRVDDATLARTLEDCALRYARVIASKGAELRESVLPGGHRR